MKKPETKTVVDFTNTDAEVYNALEMDAYLTEREKEVFQEGVKKGEAMGHSRFNKASYDWAVADFKQMDAYLVEQKRLMGDGTLTGAWKMGFNACEAEQKKKDKKLAKQLRDQAEAVLNGSGSYSERYLAHKALIKLVEELGG